MELDLMEILLSEKKIQDGVANLANELNAKYDGKPLTIIGILTGSLMFLADLVRILEMPMRVGVVQASSYRDGTKRGPITLNVEMMPDIRGRDVLLLDDIFDTGNTMLEVLKLVNELGPTSVQSAVLLRKTGCCEVPIEPDYALFEIPNEFVVGYGLDYDDHYRNLPYVGVLDSSEIESTRCEKERVR